MYDIAAPHLSHADDEAQPSFGGARSRPDGGARKLAWAVGVSLIAMGALGLSADRILWMFDSAAIGVGVLALPPVTAWVRRHVHMFPRHGLAHATLALLVLGGAFALNVSGLVRGPATFPALPHVRDAGFGEVRLTDPAVLTQRAEAAKAEYIAKVQGALSALEREQKLMRELDAAPSAYDEAVLADRAALVAARGTVNLTAEENALVNKLAAKVAAARAALAPGLRRAYVEELNQPLASYGLSARMVGEDGIEFVGAALADPQRQQTILSLTEKDRARLGFASARFVAAGGIMESGPSASAQEPHAAPEVEQAGAGARAAIAPAAVKGAAEPPPQNPPA